MRLPLQPVELRTSTRKNTARPVSQARVTSAPANHGGGKNVSAAAESIFPCRGDARHSGGVNGQQPGFFKCLHRGTLAFAASTRPAACLSRAPGSYPRRFDLAIKSRQRQWQGRSKVIVTLPPIEPPIHASLEWIATCLAKWHLLVWSLRHQLYQFIADRRGVGRRIVDFFQANSQLVIVPLFVIETLDLAIKQCPVCAA